MVSNTLDYEIIKKIFKNDITKYNIDKEHIIQSILKIKYLPNILLKEICVYDGYFLKGIVIGIFY